MLHLLEAWQDVGIADPIEIQWPESFCFLKLSYSLLTSVAPTGFLKRNENLGWAFCFFEERNMNKGF